LRDITLFHETLNKARQPFRLTISPAIAATDLPTDTDAAIAYLRRATLSLGGRDTPQVSLLQASRRPGRARHRPRNIPVPPPPRLEIGALRRSCRINPTCPGHPP
jgi:hypothetical protein